MVAVFARERRVLRRERDHILGAGLIMVLTLMYFPNGIVGTLARKNKLPRWLNWD